MHFVDSVAYSMGINNRDKDLSAFIKLAAFQGQDRGVTRPPIRIILFPQCEQPRKRVRLRAGFRGRSWLASATACIRLLT